VGRCPKASLGAYNPGFFVDFRDLSLIAEKLPKSLRRYDRPRIESRGPVFFIATVRLFGFRVAFIWTRVKTSREAVFRQVVEQHRQTQDSRP
jgi:hypothetical protein